MRLNAILETTISNRKNAVGQTKFSTSSIQDPHIVRAINIIAAATGKTPDVVADFVTALAQEDLNVFTKAPLLYDTINQNIIESKVFNLLKEIKVPNTPVFEVRTFMKLVRHVAAEHDEFWPLRGFVDRRPLDPAFEFVPPEDQTIKTAAASPKGVFYFNTGFMQRLLDYAVIKQIKPQGAKYEANGGVFPDGYAYIEFLIMHEFMHYSADDFYYQKILPNADPNIINWVGDFRSNYLLVKSGFEQLPIGLYNDSINYDRQAQYIEMYNLVKQEMDNMDPDKKDAARKKLDDLADDHKPGQKDGNGSTQKIPGDAGSKIDDNAKRIAGNIADGEPSRGEGTKPGRPKNEQGDTGSTPGSPGDGQSSAYSVDYTKIRPQFNWTTLLKRFITSQKPQSEETYSRPSRRGISGLDVARQLGVGAMKPGELVQEHVDLKLALVLDTSGSMQGSLGKVFANTNALLKLPTYKKSNVMIIRFSDKHDIWKVNFSQNKAEQIAPTPGTINTAHQLFSSVDSGGTNITTGLASDMAGLLAQGYNVLIISDSDICSGTNVNRLVGLVTMHARNMFILFDTAKNYQEWRKTTGIGTANISHMT